MQRNEKTTRSRNIRKHDGRRDDGVRIYVLHYCARLESGSILGGKRHNTLRISASCLTNWSLEIRTSRVDGKCKTTARNRTIL